LIYGIQDYLSFLPYVSSLGILSHKNLGTSVNVKQWNMPLLPTDIIIVGMTGSKSQTPTADGLHHAMP
jgi:hypothetical protein